MEREIERRWGSEKKREEREIERREEIYMKTDRQEGQRQTGRQSYRTRDRDNQNISTYLSTAITMSSFVTSVDLIQYCGNWYIYSFSVQPYICLLLQLRQRLCW